MNRIKHTLQNIKHDYEHRKFHEEMLHVLARDDLYDALLNADMKSCYCGKKG